MPVRGSWLSNPDIDLLRSLYRGSFPLEDNLSDDNASIQCLECPTIRRVRITVWLSGVRLCRKCSTRHQDWTKPKACSRCKTVFPAEEFVTTKTHRDRATGGTIDKTKKNNACGACRKLIRARDAAKRPKQSLRKYNLARRLWYSTGRCDRGKGWTNDLSIGFIEETIANGCSYCLDTKSRMSLDRIDNTKPHLKSNVVPACLRCNVIRRDMPAEAWAKLIPGLREIVKEGLFGDWIGYPPMFKEK